ncbi:PEP-CTERM sorting domain-containing protein, partial [bacterium]
DSTNPQGTFTTVNFGNTFDVAAGQTIGLAVFYVTPGNASNPNAGGFIGYNSGANTYSDGSATISTGITKGYDGTYAGDPNALFGIAQTFPGRSFSGRVQYAPASAVPEPVSIAAIGLGLVGLVSRRRKRA